ncbi:MAG TPA: DnaA N-terminal domain-containing protein [Bacillota bacterium]|nr:DnaA N-terminal domain-containing protein [Bacillota bacterium]
MNTWNEVLQRLQKKLSVPSYETWFSDTKLIQTQNEDKVLTIAVKNEFNADWLQTRYKELIGDIVKELKGEAYTLEFVIDPSLSPTLINDSKYEHRFVATSTFEAGIDKILQEIQKVHERIKNVEKQLEKLTKPDQSNTSK